MALTMNDRVNFITSIYSDAESVSNASNKNLKFILAQTALETGWGAKTIPGTNNLFNIKADSSWTGETLTYPAPERINGKIVMVESEWRVYDSYEDSITDWLDFLRSNPRYSEVFDPSVSGDLEKVAQAMEDAHYATIND